MWSEQRYKALDAYCFLVEYILDVFRDRKIFQETIYIFLLKNRIFYYCIVLLHGDTIINVYFFSLI